jgi:hypothetical protein
MTPDSREEKLPVWAAATIERLRRQVAEERHRADEARLSGGPEDTDTVIDPYDDEPVRLPKGQRVRFYVGPEAARQGIDRHRDYIDVRVESGNYGPVPRLVLHGGGSVVVRPHVTNVITATVE